MAVDLVVAIVLVLANGFFVGAEFAIARLRPTQVAELVREGRVLDRTDVLVADDFVASHVRAHLELGFREDLRDYGIGAQILRDLGVRRVRLLTNNPQKIGGLETYGIEVVARAPLEVAPHAGNIEYLRTKQAKLGHLLSGLRTS